VLDVELVGNVRQNARVVSTPAGIDCAAGDVLCQASLPVGSVTLVSNRRVTSWSIGACTGKFSCTFNLSANLTVFVGY